MPHFIPRARRAALPCAVALALIAAPLLAETVAGQTAGPMPVADLLLSHRMFTDGQAAGDTMMVLAAATLRRDVLLDPAGGGDPLADPQIAGWRDMLDVARGMAGDDADLIGMIDDDAALRTRGVSTGALFRNARLDAGGAAEFEAISFDAGVAAEVYVEGVAAADLNLFVYDEAKALVCADEDTSYIAHCYWEPERPGQYVIKVVNLGAIPSSYALITN